MSLYALQGVNDHYINYMEIGTGDSASSETGLHSQMKKLEIELRFKGLSFQTIKSYLYHNKEFIEHLKRKTGYLTDEDVKNYISFLIENNTPIAASLALSAIRFFYKEIINCKTLTNNSQTEYMIPDILTKKEVKKMIYLTKNIKNKILLELLYGCGLRVSEAVRIKSTDVDLKSRALKVRNRKNERSVPIPMCACHDIEFFLKHKDDNNPYLFPSEYSKEQHISVNIAHSIIEQVAERAGIKKRVHPHTLRYSYATHLLEQGIDFALIQELLGNSNHEASEAHRKTFTFSLKKIKNPLDTFQIKTGMSG